MKRNTQNRIPLFIKTIIIGVVLAAVFYMGNIIGRATLEPHANAYAVMTHNSVEVLKVETKTTYYIETRENTVEAQPARTATPIHETPKNFKDLEELQKWIQYRNTFFFKYPDNNVDCDDFAIALQRDALADGYLMNFQIITPNEYNTIFRDTTIPLEKLHAVDMVIIGNDAYLIEPQTGEVEPVAWID